jgi:hypothetical protein
MSTRPGFARKCLTNGRPIARAIRIQLLNYWNTRKLGAKPTCGAAPQVIVLARLP